MFITFEGIDGSGKTTQIECLKDFLEQKGYNVITTREPGGTHLSERIRELLLNTDYNIDPITELFLFNASRMHLINTIIKPALKNNIIVISDRFYDSTTAYQGYGRSISLENINKCNDIIKSFGIIPDITLFLDIDIKVSEERRSSMEKDRIELSNESFFEKVRGGYLCIADEEPNRIKIINANRDKQSIFEDIKKYILPLLPTIAK